MTDGGWFSSPDTKTMVLIGKTWVDVARIIVVDPTGGGSRVTIDTGGSFITVNSSMSADDVINRVRDALRGPEYPEVPF